MLAFGLEDGFVGVYDTAAASHALAPAYHAAAVTSLAWLTPRGGPAVLCSCGDDEKALLHAWTPGALAAATRIGDASVGDAVRAAC